MNAYEDLLEKYITICCQINDFKKKANTNCECYVVKTYSRLKFVLYSCTSEFLYRDLDKDCPLNDRVKAIKLLNMFAKKSIEFENFFIDNFRIIKKT